MKYIQYVRFGLIAISVIVMALFLVTMNGTTGDYPHVDMMFYWTYVLVASSIGLVIVLSVLNMAKNPKSAVRSLIGVGLLAIVLLISYALSSSETVTTASNVYDNPSVLKLSDLGLFATYITFGLAVVAIIGAEAAKMFRK